MKNQFLVGKKIYLRGLSKKDLKGNYIKWFNDPEVCKYNSHHVFPYMKESAENYIKKVENFKSDLVLAIILKENDLHIGNVSLQNINYINHNAEFAIIIGEKSDWRKGYSKEAAKMIIEHGFLKLNLHRIYCGTSCENIPMQKLALFLGMKEEGRRIDVLYKDGKFVNIIEYGLLKYNFLR